MSRSGWRLGLDFHMLEGRKACVPGFEDSSGGHTRFTTKIKLRSGGPASNVFDGITWGLHGEELPQEYDEEAWVELYAKRLAEELTFDDNRTLKQLMRNLFKQAKQHCDEHHADVRERLKPK